MKKQVIVVGAGFSGATCARQLAEDNFDVTIIEKFNHIGGNAYDYLDKGIYVHQYGPHIFHTNLKESYDFLSKYTQWFPYEHRVLANLKGNYVPVPFNMESLKRCYPYEEYKEIEKILVEEYGEGKKVPIMELRKNPNPKIKEIAEFVVKNIFVTYSEKQWGTTIDKLDPNTMARVPVYTSYEDRYFTDTYQFQPKEGYTKLFENILNHKNIKVLLNTQAKDVLEVKDNQVYYNGEAFDGYVVFTGPIDEFFDNKFGKLPYRSLRFDFETHQEESYQPAAVVNYTVDQDYTRISEFKKFTTENPPKDNTVIVKEYSLEYKQNEGMIPYYPIINEENSAMFEKYKNYCQGIKNFYLLGRLGNYKYINMDMAVKLALELAEEIKNKENGR